MKRREWPQVYLDLAAIVAKHRPWWRGADPGPNYPTMSLKTARRLTAAEPDPMPPWWEYQEERAKVDLAAVGIGADASNDGEVG